MEKTYVAAAKGPAKRGKLEGQDPAETCCVETIEWQISSLTILKNTVHKTIK